MLLIAGGLTRPHLNGAEPPMSGRLLGLAVSLPSSGWGRLPLHADLGPLHRVGPLWSLEHSGDHREAV
jgi:hypothetical protein